MKYIIDYGLSKIMNSWLKILAMPLISLILVASIPLFIFSYIVGSIILWYNARKSLRDYRNGNYLTTQEIINELEK